MPKTTPLEELEERINEWVTGIQKELETENVQFMRNGYTIKLNAYNRVLSVITTMKPKPKKHKKERKSLPFLSDTNHSVNPDNISTEFVHSVLGNHRISINGYNIRMDSQRYELFSTKGCQCITCGSIGTHYRLTTDLKNPNVKAAHLNLYTDAGVLMTNDHVVPVSLGGESTLDNYQTMCTICNARKCNSTKE